MKTIRKLLIILLSVSAIACLFTGCSNGKTEKPTETVTVNATETVKPTPTATPTPTPTSTPTPTPILTPTPTPVQTPEVTPAVVETPVVTDEVMVVSDWRITLKPDNQYIKIENLDYSECIYEDGYFEGDIKFNMEITQDYVSKYREYDYVAQVYLGFYNEKGILVYDEVIEHDFTESDFDGFAKKYAKSCEVSVSSRYPISEVKILKVACEKSKIVFEGDNEYIKISNIDLSDCECSYGRFRGNAYYILEITQDYVDKYLQGYKFRGGYVYMGFYNEAGMLLGIDDDYFFCGEEHISEEANYVYIDSTLPAAYVKVLRIECAQ